MKIKVDSRWWPGIFLLLCASCASLKSSSSPELSEAQDEPGVLYSLDEASEETENEGTEPVEGTPEDIGAVEVSEQRSEKEILADQEARRTFPLVQNEFVDQWINYFTGRGRRHFEVYLLRSTRYISMMKKALAEDGLPEDLIYLAMIESGFNTKARSRAKAVGPWQFMKGTGQRYGLEVDYWVDERRDFIKSTHAAAQYLKELHQIFGTWYLAAAGYNAGEGRVLNAVRRSKTRNFWELARSKDNFRAETRNYVPKMIAAALISKNPEKYGFENIPYENPLSWDLIDVPGGLSLRSIANSNNLDLEELKLLNPELVRAITPSSAATYGLRVPQGTGEKVLASLPSIKKQPADAFIVHKVARGQTLGAIANKYDSSVDVIMDFNNIRKATQVRAGSYLRIPVDDDKSKFKSVKRKTFSNPVSSSQKSENKGLQKYRVKRGDSWWSLAGKFGVSIKELREINRGVASLVAGDSINIPKL